MRFQSSAAKYQTKPANENPPISQKTSRAKLYANLVLLKLQSQKCKKIKPHTPTNTQAAFSDNLTKREGNHRQQKNILSYKSSKQDFQGINVSVKLKMKQKSSMIQGRKKCHRRQ